jgi:hypothetical protein
MSLLPAIIGAHWFEPSAAASPGAAKLAGYPAAALLARPFSARVPVVVTLAAMMLLATAAFFACAYSVSFACSRTPARRTAVMKTRS